MLLGVTKLWTAIDGLGVVSAFVSPRFLVTFPHGERQWRPLDVARALCWGRQEFLDPRTFFDDWSVVSPLCIPGWTNLAFEYLERSHASLPEPWRAQLLRAANGRPHTPHFRMTCPDDLNLLSPHQFIRRERELLRVAFLSLAGSARAPRTIRNLLYPGLKLLWWLASRGHPLPPTQWAVVEYLTFLTTRSRKRGPLSGARGALLLLCGVNGWDPAPYTSGAAMIPGAAIARLSRHQVKKSAGLTLHLVQLIILRYCFSRPGRTAEEQWELAIGVAIVVAYKVFARWDDLAQLRWDDEFCELAAQYIRFFLEHRKTAQFEGNFADIARSADPQLRGAYQVICEARSVFRRGYVLPFISSRGVVDTSRPMPYQRYVWHLRQVLVCCGLSPERARTFAGQSARAGAATTAAHAGMSPHDICRMAGVSSIGWHLGYMRPDAEDRLCASRALGL